MANWYDYVPRPQPISPQFQAAIGTAGQGRGIEAAMQTPSFGYWLNRFGAANDLANYLYTQQLNEQGAAEAGHRKTQFEQSENERAAAERRRAEHEAADANRRLAPPVLKKFAQR